MKVIADSDNLNNETNRVISNDTLNEDAIHLSKKNNDLTPDLTNREYLSIEDLLDIEMSRKHTETWNKLDKSVKVKKLLDYADVISKRESLNDEDKIKLNKQLLSYLDKKLLQRNRDVSYDRESGTITGIPALDWTSASRRFTLRRTPKTTATKTRRKPEKIERSDKD